jgi:putative oxidoreductase
MFTLYWFDGFFELFGGALLLLGLFTGPIAFILSDRVRVWF